MLATNDQPCWVVTPDPPLDDGPGDRHFTTEAEARQYAADMTSDDTDDYGPGRRRVWNVTHRDKPCATLTCDGEDCGYVFDEDDEGIVHFDDAEQAHRSQTSSNPMVPAWRFATDGRAWCCECDPPENIHRLPEIPGQLALTTA